MLYRIKLGWSYWLLNVWKKTYVIMKLYFSCYNCVWVLTWHVQMQCSQYISPSTDNGHTGPRRGWAFSLAQHSIMYVTLNPAGFLILRTYALVDQNKRVLLSLLSVALTVIGIGSVSFHVHSLLKCFTSIWTESFIAFQWAIATYIDISPGDGSSVDFSSLGCVDMMNNSE